MDTMAQKVPLGWGPMLHVPKGRTSEDPEKAVQGAARPELRPSGTPPRSATAAVRLLAPTPMGHRVRGYGGGS